MNEKTFIEEIKEMLRYLFLAIGCYFVLVGGVAAQYNLYKSTLVVFIGLLIWYVIY